MSQDKEGTTGFRIARRLLKVLERVCADGDRYCGDGDLEVWLARKIRLLECWVKR